MATTSTALIPALDESRVSADAVAPAAPDAALAAPESRTVFVGTVTDVWASADPRTSAAATPQPDMRALDLAPTLTDLAASLAGRLSDALVPVSAERGVIDLAMPEHDIVAIAEADLSSLDALWAAATSRSAEAPAVQVDDPSSMMMCGCAACAAAQSDRSGADLSDALTPELAPARAPGYAIDAVINEYDYQWGTNGNPVTVTYSFLGSVPSYYGAAADERKNFVPMNATQQGVVREILQMYSEVANITFQEVAGVGSITFATANLGAGIAGWAYYPRNGFTGATDGNAYGDVWITNLYASYANPVKGTWEYNAFIHEIGHAIGLKHPGNYNAGGGGTGGPYLPTAEDTHQYTVMSYSSGPYGGREPITPQIYDVAAVQNLYGANTSTRAGNDTYTFSTSYQVKTIWDGGGFDTFDASNQGSGVTIDLHAGSFSSIAGVNNIAIAYGAGIEKAIGSNYNDTLTANDDGSTLIGGVGSDVLIGGAGRDTLTGGTGGDRFVFSTGGSSAAAGFHDLITDFAVGVDKIDLRMFDAISATGAIDTFDFLGTASFSGLAGSLNYFFDTVRGVTVLQGDTNGDRFADFAIDLTGAFTLTVSDVLGAVANVVIESAGATRLVLTGTRYTLRDSTGAGPTLKYGATDYVDGQLTGWSLIGAEKTSSGYLVAWKYTFGDQYFVWATDGNGVQTAMAVPAVSGADFRLQQIETSFQQDLNGDGTIGAPVIAATALETGGAIKLSTTGSVYYLLDGANKGPTLKFQGANVAPGQFGGWTPVGAETMAGGFVVALKLTGVDQFTFWSTDGNGTYTGNLVGILTGGDFALQQYEQSFQQDFNADGTIGPVFVDATGTAKLATAGGKFYLLDNTGSGPTLKFGASDFVAGQLGGWTPVSVEKTASGYYLAMTLTGGDQYTVWVVNSDGLYIGNAVGALSGSDSSLHQFEVYFQKDLNADGTVGVPAIVAAAVEAGGDITLGAVGGKFYLLDSGNHGPTLKFAGADFVAGQLGNWTPIGAEKSASGYVVAMKLAGADQYTIWTTDQNGTYNGNLVGAVSGADLALKRFEILFEQDLNGDGTIGLPALDTSGAINLVTSGNKYYLLDDAGAGPSLKFGGADVVIGQFGGWEPIGVEKSAGGYTIALKLAGADQFTIWSADANGTYTGNLVGALSGTDAGLQRFETALQQDLNGDGTVGLPTVETSGATDLAISGGKFYLLDSAGVGPTLKFAGADFVAGQLGGWTPIGAEKTASGYTVAMKLSGVDQYTVWSTDANGMYNGNFVGALTGSDPSLKAFEVSLQQDLNGDTRVGAPVAAGAAAASVLVGTDGHDTFVFDPDFGNVAVEGLSLGEDALHFNPALFADLSSVAAHVTDDAAGNAVIAATAYDSVTLVGVTSATLLQHLNDLVLIQA